MVITYTNAKVEPEAMSIGYGEKPLLKTNAIIKEIGINKQLLY